MSLRCLADVNKNIRKRDASRSEASGRTSILEALKHFGRSFTELMAITCPTKHEARNFEIRNRLLQHRSPDNLELRSPDNNAIMATELTVQSERAYQKQPHIFLNSKSKVKSARVGKGGRRWYKDVGLGFRTPKTAIEGNYIGM